MKRVWIAQCLCPQRHAILAASIVADDESDAARNCLEPLRQTVGEMLDSGAINPWCGLCNAPPEAWHYEVGRTRFTTMKEATPALMRQQAENLVTNMLFGDLDRKQKPN